MSNYTKITNFAAKDTLVSGNPAKVIKGSEVGAEYDAIAVAVNSKSNSASPTFTGTVTAANLTVSGTEDLSPNPHVRRSAENSRGPRRPHRPGSQTPQGSQPFTDALVVVEKTRGLDGEFLSIKSFVSIFLCDSRRKVSSC